MRWIELSKARGLEFNAPVFTKDKDGVFGLGRLMEKKHTKDGIEHRFMMATFLTTDEPFSDIITHVAKPK